MPDPDDYLSVKELGDALNRHPSYVYALKKEMIRRGFPWPAGRTTLFDVKAFFRSNPKFRKRRSW